MTSVELVYPDGRVELRPVTRQMFTRLRRAAKSLGVGETTMVRGVQVTRLS
jgi:hypothetical protein